MSTATAPLHTVQLGEQGSPLVFCHGLFGQGRNWTQIGKQFGLRTATLIGGAPMRPQQSELRNNPDIVWAATLEHMRMSLLAVAIALPLAGPGQVGREQHHFRQALLAARPDWAGTIAPPPDMGEDEKREVASHTPLRRWGGELEIARAVLAMAPEREDSKIRAFKEEVLQHMKGPGKLVDVRSPDEFSGKKTHMPEYPQEGVLRGGHIPGARSVPWAKAANPDGSFKSAEELRTIYEKEQGLKPNDDVIAYCRIGERSSHTWFVLHELLGYSRVRNYDGSWTEWGNSVRLPIAVGEDRGELPR